MRIDDILDKLKNGTYTWKPVRRIYIPKSDGKIRPLGIPCWSDKLVQEVLRMVMEAYYEPIFRESAHGFRPNRGCHTALSMICNQWRGTKWFIEGDIKGCFDHIDHEILLQIIGQSIEDECFLKLLREMLKAGYMEDWKGKQTYSGIPQGGILSPLLANIILNEFDEYVEDVFIPKHTRGSKRKLNPEYSRLKRLRGKAKQQGKKEEYRRTLEAMRTIPTGQTDGGEYSRLRYGRYADDFLLGFTGTKEEAEGIRQEIKEHLATIGLELSEEKTLITHAGTEEARFLNYHISTIWENTKLTKVNEIKKRTVNGTIWLRVPQDVMTTWASKVLKKGTVMHRPELVNHSDYDIITSYEVRLQGLINDYSMANNVSDLYKLRSLYGLSLLKT